MKKYVELEMFLRHISGISVMQLSGKTWESSVSKAQSGDKTILGKLDQETQDPEKL